MRGAVEHERHDDERMPPRGVIAILTLPPDLRRIRREPRDGEAAEDDEDGRRVVPESLTRVGVGDGGAGADGLAEEIQRLAGRRPSPRVDEEREDGEERKRRPPTPGRQPDAVEERDRRQFLPDRDGVRERERRPSVPRRRVRPDGEHQQQGRRQFGVAAEGEAEPERLEREERKRHERLPRAHPRRRLGRRERASGGDEAVEDDDGVAPEERERRVEHLVARLRPVAERARRVVPELPHPDEMRDLVVLVVAVGGEREERVDRREPERQADEHAVGDDERRVVEARRRGRTGIGEAGSGGAGGAAPTGARGGAGGGRGCGAGHGRDWGATREDSGHPARAGRGREAAATPSMASPLRANPAPRFGGGLAALPDGDDLSGAGT